MTRQNLKRLVFQLSQNQSIVEKDAKLMEHFNREVLDPIQTWSMEHIKNAGLHGEFLRRLSEDSSASIEELSDACLKTVWLINLKKEP